MITVARTDSEQSIEHNTKRKRAIAKVLESLVLGTYFKHFVSAL